MNNISNRHYKRVRIKRIQKKRNSNTDSNNESESTTVVRLSRRKLSFGLPREESFMIGDLAHNNNCDYETSDHNA